MGQAPDTLTQTLLREFATSYKKRHGRAPSIREIADALLIDYHRAYNLCRGLPDGIVWYSNPTKVRPTR